MRGLRLFLPIVLLAGSLAVFWPGSGRHYVEVSVAQGATGYGVARALKDQGLIAFVHPFLFWIKMRGAGAKMKVGRYRFSQGRAAFWLVDDLINGRTQKVKVVIPEGFSSWQIAERLDEADVCPKADFENVVKAKKWEGFLFPATYEMDLGYGADVVAQILKRQSDQKWTADMDARANAINMTREEVVTLASILEREAVVPDELNIISSVYHNRLKKNMPLQADPTVQYALGYWKQRLLFSDYRNVKSPYNTYLHAGLPPGPICSPGLKSIDAALNPAQTDFLYFVAGDNGRHTFSTNYRDHSNKVNKRNKKR